MTDIVTPGFNMGLPKNFTTQPQPSSTVGLSDVNSKQTTIICTTKGSL